MSVCKPWELTYVVRVKVALKKKTEGYGVVYGANLGVGIVFRVLQCWGVRSFDIRVCWDESPVL